MKRLMAIALVLLGALMVIFVTLAGMAVLRASQLPESAGLIPNERALIAAGLSGTPTPGQASSPIAVDRVVVDDAHIFVQYHARMAAGASALYAVGVLDDRGRLLNEGVGGSCRPDYPWLALPSWFPWHPQVRARCLAWLDLALPASSRGVHVVLSAGTQEDVWVPLRLDGLRLFRITRPSVTVVAGGITIRLDELANGPLGGHVTLTATPWFGALEHLLLVTADGRRVPVRTLDAGCDNVCTETGSFSALPPGTRAVLTAGRLSNGRPVPFGSWQFRLVMP